MARQKNDPEIVNRKKDLAERIKQLRIRRFGERGGPELARRLGLPVRTWYNYENGVTIPAEILLDFLNETGYSFKDLTSGGYFVQFRRETEIHNIESGDFVSGDPDLPSINKPNDFTNQATRSRVVIQIDDKGMSPWLPPGTIVKLGEVIPSDLWKESVDQLVVLWNVQKPLIRRLVLESNRFVLKPDNRSFEEISIDNNSRSGLTLHRVAWFRLPEESWRAPGHRAAGD
jgi:transcriptional regulator with XRE-family HTH domain